MDSDGAACVACLEDLSGESITWPGCQQPHCVHPGCLSAMLATLPGWPPDRPPPGELGVAVGRSLRAAHPDDPPDTAPHLDCPSCRHPWDDAESLCAAVCALPQWPHPALRDPLPAMRPARPPRPLVAPVMCGGPDPTDMEWSTFQRGSEWEGEWQCRADSCGGAHTAPARPMVPTLWLRPCPPQSVLPACHCGATQLRPVIFHASRPVQDPWSAEWVCMQCGVWDASSRGAPADADALMLAAGLLDSTTWAAACAVQHGVEFWRRVQAFAASNLTEIPPGARQS